MEAPLCRGCDTRHWSTQPCPARVKGKPKDRAITALTKKNQRKKAKRRG